MAFDEIFQPLKFRNLTIKNRILRSNVSGRFDNYDGSGNQARINWETKFAKGGVGAIVSSFVPVHLRGRIVPNYAMIDDDRHIPFWKKVGEAVHAHDCKYILQLSHSGRQRDVPGIEYATGLSSTGKSDPSHGFRCESATKPRSALPVLTKPPSRKSSSSASADVAESDVVAVPNFPCPSISVWPVVAGACWPLVPCGMAGSGANAKIESKQARGCVMMELEACVRAGVRTPATHGRHTLRCRP